MASYLRILVSSTKGGITRYMSHPHNPLLCKSKMLKEAINIKFPQDPDPNIRNRALNYIEDIFRYLEDHQLGTIHEIDSYSNGEFKVRIKSKRKLGEIKREIIRLLNQHNLAGEGAINLIARNPR